MEHSSVLAIFAPARYIPYTDITEMGGAQMAGCPTPVAYSSHWRNL